jgi:hypothetical protein
MEYRAECMVCEYRGKWRASRDEAIEDKNRHKRETIHATIIREKLSDAR